MEPEDECGLNVGNIVSVLLKSKGKWGFIGEIIRLIREIMGMKKRMKERQELRG